MSILFCGIFPEIPNFPDNFSYVNEPTHDNLAVGTPEVYFVEKGENYREKRNVALESLAQKLAAKAMRTGRNQTLEPMNAYERRIIHSSLQEKENVTTYSIGEEPNRKVVVALEKKSK